MIPERWTNLFSQSDPVTASAPYLYTAQSCMKEMHHDMVSESRRGTLMTEEERISSIAVLGHSPCDDNAPQLRAFGYIILVARVWLTDECLSFSSFKKKMLQIISRLKFKLPVCELTEVVYLKFHPFAHPSVDVDFFFNPPCYCRHFESN